MTAHQRLAVDALIRGLPPADAVWPVHLQQRFLVALHAVLDLDQDECADAVGPLLRRYLTQLGEGRP